MCLPATKWTSEVIAAAISGMGNKKNLTMPAAFYQRPQVRMMSEHRTKGPIILRNYTSTSSFSVPVRNKFKKGLNLNYKKANSLLVWLIKSDIPSLFLFIVSHQYSGITGVLFYAIQFPYPNVGGWCGV